MPSYHVALAIFPAIGALVAAALTIYCWRRPDTLGAREFAAFSGCVFLWTLFSTLETLSLDGEQRALFARLTYTGIAYSPVAWVAFIVRYGQRDAWLRPPAIAAACVVPTVTLLLALSQPLHTLLWREVTFRLEPYPMRVVVHGPWFDFVHVPYTYGLYLVGIGLLALQLGGGPRRQRHQELALLAAALVPFVASGLYVLSDVTLWGLDPTPVTLAFSALLIAWALFGTGLLREVPLSYRTVFLHSSDGIILTDPRGLVVDANPTALGPRDLREVVRRPLREAFPALHAALQDAAPDATETGVRYRSASDPGRTLEARERTVSTRGGRPAGRALLVRDVTLEQRTFEALERRAEADALTALPNRRALERHARTALRGPASDPDLALLYIDLDGFKEVNDRYGHTTGDTVLREAATRLRGALREDDLLARLGGDEFVALTRCATLDAANALADRLRAALEPPIETAGARHDVSASIGVAHASEHGDTLRELLEHADDAMYRDKRDRRAPPGLGG